MRRAEQDAPLDPRLEPFARALAELLLADYERQRDRAAKKKPEPEEEPDERDR